jgi:alcohol dehydrogenase (cytochrome c)
LFVPLGGCVAERSESLPGPQLQATSQQNAPPQPAGEAVPTITEPDGQTEPDQRSTETQATSVAQFEVGDVDTDDLLAASTNNGSWLTYGRTYDAHRYSPLKQINQTNVQGLIPRWVFQTGVTAGFECTPLVIDGIMYISTPWNHIYAVDARTGRGLWHYKRELPDNMSICCGPVNRGLAAWRDRLYMTTLDAHVICLARDSVGEVTELIWDTKMADYEDNFSATVAPLIVKDMVIAGISGAEYGIRGFVVAYDAMTGQERWRFQAVPDPNDETVPQEVRDSWGGTSWMTGGGSSWVTGTYDPELGLVYWGIGNPAPDFNGDVRPGDNLYTDCVVALEADSGKLRWYFQYTPHDVWDYDGVNTPVLVDIQFDGDDEPTRCLVQANRNGYFYCLNRETGKLIYGKPFCKVTWANGLDPETGRPEVNPAAMPSVEGSLVYPGVPGGKNWPHMSYSPDTGLAYLPVINNGGIFTEGEVQYIRGQMFMGSAMTPVENESSGHLKAIDVRTGEIRWETPTKSPMLASVLTTAGGIGFSGDPEGYFFAFDLERGEFLWNFQCGSGHHGSPITYELDGKQYVAVCVGWGGPGAKYREGAPWFVQIPNGCAVYVFALPD